eukprot:Em0018g614a
MSTTNEFRVQYIDDVDPFNVLASLKHAEPTVPKRYSFIADTPLCDQVAGLKRYLRAPHKIDVVALLYYRREENEVKQLDIDATLSELMSEHGIVPDKAGTIVLRTKLSVRVHTIIETLLNAEGNKLRQALFSLKRMFQDDEDLVLEFVFNQGLNALVNVGKDSDQTFQQYIIKALGEVAVYVDGMNGLMACNELIQWLYLLTESKARMVVKAALELLVVFVNYSEQSDTSTANLSAKGVDSPRMNSPEGLSTALLFKDAVDIVSENRGLKPWFFLINLIDEKSSADADVQAMAMSLINKTLGGLSDEENFYDVVDCLETLGIESCMIYHKNKKKNADLQKEFDKYEETISQAYNIEYETAGRSRKLVRTSTTILPQASTPTAPPAPRRSQSVKPDVGEQPSLDLSSLLKEIGPAEVPKSQLKPPLPPSALSTKKDAQTSSSAVEDRDKTKVTQTGSKTEQSVKGKSLPQDSKSKVTDQPLSKSKDLSGDESGKQKSSGVKESTSQTAPGSALPSSLLTTTSTTSLASPAQATRPSSAKAAVGSAGQGSPSLSSRSGSALTTSVSTGSQPILAVTTATTTPTRPGSASPTLARTSGAQTTTTSAISARPGSAQGLAKDSVMTTPSSPSPVRPSTASAAPSTQSTPSTRSSSSTQVTPSTQSTPTTQPSSTRSSSSTQPTPTTQPSSTQSTPTTRSSSSTQSTPTTRSSSSTQPTPTTRSSSSTQSTPTTQPSSSTQSTSQSASSTPVTSSAASARPGTTAQTSASPTLSRPGSAQGAPSRTAPKSADPTPSAAPTIIQSTAALTTSSSPSPSRASAAVTPGSSLRAAQSPRLSATTPPTAATPTTTRSVSVTTTGAVTSTTPSRTGPLVSPASSASRSALTQAAAPLDPGPVGVASVDPTPPLTAAKRGSPGSSSSPSLVSLNSVPTASATHPSLTTAPPSPPSPPINTSSSSEPLQSSNDAVLLRVQNGFEDITLCSSRTRERRTSWTRGKDNSDETSSKRSSAADKSPEKSPEHCQEAWESGGTQNRHRAPHSNAEHSGN